MNSKKVMVVGIGMNGSETLTEYAKKLIESADILIGAERILKCFEYLKKPVLSTYNSSKISKFLHTENFETAAVLMSGDCGFFSGTARLLPEISDMDYEIVCGISSVVYFCSKIGISWQNMKFVSLHGMDSNIVRHAAENEKTFFLLGGKISAAQACRRLCEYSMNSAEVYIGENLGYENERILCSTAEDFTETETALLSVMTVVNSDCETLKRSGIPDREFVRGNVPMTKSEVRSVIISKLGISNDSVCWDIGSGTGSVSVEMALQCGSGRVYAVDRNPEAVSLTDKNKHIFKCDNIEIIGGNAMDNIEKLPVPDRVFIGGSGGELQQIIKMVFKKNRKAVIVVTAVSLETLNKSLEGFRICGAETEIVQVSITRTKSVGEYTMLCGENPVFIIKGTIL